MEAVVTIKAAPQEYRRIVSALEAELERTKQQISAKQYGMGGLKPLQGKQVELQRILEKI